MNYKLSLGFLALAMMLAFSCKKKKKDDVTTTPDPDGYYIKAKVNGTLHQNIGGIDGNTTSPDVTVDDLGGGAKEVSYFSSIYGMATYNNFFELSRPNVEITDGNDSDEMTTIFTKGDKNLDAGSTGSYSLTYHGPNSTIYLPKYSDPAVVISIDSVADLGSISGKRVVKVIGTFDSLRVYQYDYELQMYTSNYLDITDAEFVLPYKSNSDY